MSKNKITVYFRLFSMGSVLLFSILSKVLILTYRWSVSDVMIEKIVTTILLRGYELFNIITVALVITTTVYAHAYFGKKTCMSVSLVSLGCLALGKVLMFVYNCIVNELSAAQLISGALSYTVEILFDTLLITVAIIFSYIFAKKRCNPHYNNPNKAFSPEKTAISVAGAYYFIQIVDLSAMNVIPFFVMYGSPTQSELQTMISDYLFYILSFPVSVLFIFAAFFLTRKITGKLVLKKYYKS